MNVKSISIALVLIILSSNTFAKTGPKEKTGFASGLAIGAIAGGPPGAIVGAFIGVLTGNSLDEKDQQKVEIVQLKKEVSQTKSQLLSANETIEDSRLLKTAHQEFARKISTDLSIDILFRTNSVTLEPQGHSKMGPVASLLAAFPELTINVQGYADTRGTSINNLALSLERAKTVKQSLIEMGVSEERIKIEGLGERFASANGTDIEGAALDRHVAINFSTNENDAALVSNF